MRKYQHLFNVILGGYLLWMSVRMVIPAILEIQGWILLFSDQAIDNPYEIVEVYLRSGAPIMIFILLLAGCLGIPSFIQCRNGMFIKGIAILSAVGYSYPVVMMLLSHGSIIQVLWSARYLLRSILLFIGGEMWKRYLDIVSNKVEYRKRRFPYIYELNLLIKSLLDSKNI